MKLSAQRRTEPKTSAVVVATRRDGTLRLCVVADTHSLPHPQTLHHLRALAPDAILHAGDIGDLHVLDDLAAIAPVHAVRGNIDERAPDVPDALVIDIESATVRVARILLLHIAVNGPRLRADAVRAAKDVGATMIVCGHSHVPFIGEDRGLVVFNPGSAGPRRFSLPIVFGTIDISSEGMRLGHVACETGEPWTPP